MTRVPTFARNDRNQLVFTGYRDRTDDETTIAARRTADQFGVDIRRMRADAQKRSDVRGFKEQQRLLKDKAWREGYVRPVGELRGFNPNAGKRRLPRRADGRAVAA